MQRLLLPYRLNVGIALFNRSGLVLIARRIKDDGPEILEPGRDWQMPQGGVDAGEGPYVAARRELLEETGVRSVDFLAQMPDWLTYEFPEYAGPPHRLARYRGQRQRWFALRFTGPETEIDLNASDQSADPEFDSWRWAELARLPDLVVTFKRDVYIKVAEAFAQFASK